MNEKEKKELALSKIILIVLGAVGVLLVLWLGWFSPMAHEAHITSFAACTQAGNPVQESYPEVCVAKDGTRFTNPNQNIQTLHIKQWKVATKIAGTTDAYYTYDQATDEVFVSTRTLDAAAKLVQGCTSGLHGTTYERIQAGDLKDTGEPWTGEDLKDSGRLGQYYFPQKPLIEPACVPTRNTHTDTVLRLKTAIEASMRSLQSD